MIENERSTAINPGEAVEEKVSLSDRFGLWLGFHRCSQDEYLAMVDGYVTAYAHTSELLVKRGDTIKRGQIIAKSGQTGEVQSPQLHFEIRKGSTPVDPTQFLNGA
jgi:murein DD-endopeptidase MepM/ murein hydrolase activator NlpD